MLVDGDIIATGNVKADNITITASQYTAAYEYLNTEWEIVAQVTIVNTEQNVVLWTSAIVFDSAGGEDPVAIEVEIKRGSTVIWSGGVAVGGPSNPGSVPFSIVMTDEPPTGSQTYYFWARGSSIRIEKRSLVVTEYKR
jgi:hypothetical protein